MFKILKNLGKKDLLIILVVAILVIGSVFLDLKLPEYMSEITKLVQTEDSTMKEVLNAGGMMLLCAISSLICSVVVGYFTSLLAANFSKNVRRRIFAKVESFGITEMKKFSTPSLITRTTNDVSQVEMLLAMGLQLMIKAPVMAVWALLKILGKSKELSLVTRIGVIIVVLTGG